MSALAGGQPADGLGAWVMPLHRPMPPVLAVGAFLKSTVCLIDGATAVISHDVGNLETMQAVRAFEAAATRLLATAASLPAAVAHDLHPDFHSTRWAQAYANGMGMEAVAVQHHHAHVAAVMAEHGIDSPTLGLALDGFGLGTDQQAWGGELLIVDGMGYRRIGNLAPLLQPGGDRAAREPWRMGAAALHALGREDEIPARYAGQAGAHVIARMLRQNVNCPPTSSCGRLFDAACGLLGVKSVSRFEGEAPMALERLVTRAVSDPNGWSLADGVLDLRPLLDRLTGMAPAEGAGLFHGTLAAAMGEWVAVAAEATAIRRVALSGGCFLNRVLSEALVAELRRRRIEPLQPLRLPPGDGAISLGQAWAAGLARN